ncbi:uncharacterized protein LODBEIA_P35580 [Lodderomyces beijingensis]|uniref:Uncharacterized protein n=1 Tax=Lodderomyces beijingensis TaxID=1775926 RepID=A0ABP0ZN50_9ASCO
MIFLKHSRSLLNKVTPDSIPLVGSNSNNNQSGSPPSSPKVVSRRSTISSPSQHHDNIDAEISPVTSREGRELSPRRQGSHHHKKHHHHHHHHHHPHQQQHQVGDTSGEMKLDDIVEKGTRPEGVEPGAATATVAPVDGTKKLFDNVTSSERVLISIILLLILIVYLW